jgi:predicted metal-binding protein
MDKNQIEQLLKQYKFTDYKWIKTKNIETAQWVRMKCTFGCPDYGRSICPPNVPPVKECREFINEYTNALVIRFHFNADKDNYPKEYSDEITRNLLLLERDIFLCGYYKAFILNQSCCDLCKDCTKTRFDCNNPRASRPSPEAFAINVFDTIRSIGFPINVIASPQQDINRYAFMLID